MERFSTPAMPALFLAHGAPILLDMPQWVGELAGWAQTLPRPKAILIISAHWIDQPATLAATRTVPLIYDFYGFPPKYYRQVYPAPGAPELAQRMRELLEGHGPLADDPERGLDHGAYVPLVAMYPEAEVPVLQLSLPTLQADSLFRLGQALSPLRAEGVLIIGSGFLTHNMRAMDFSPMARTPGWASEFDRWTQEALEHHDVDALVDFLEKGPGVHLALPTVEHFVPLLVALGAAPDEPVSFPITGFFGGAFTRRSVQLGNVAAS